MPAVAAGVVAPVCCALLLVAAIVIISKSIIKSKKKERPHQRTYAEKKSCPPDSFKDDPDEDKLSPNKSSKSDTGTDYDNDKSVNNLSVTISDETVKYNIIATEDHDKPNNNLEGLRKRFKSSSKDTSKEPVNLEFQRNFDSNIEFSNGISRSKETAGSDSENAHEDTSDDDSDLSNSSNNLALDDASTNEHIQNFPLMGNSSRSYEISSVHDRHSTNSLDSSLSDSEEEMYKKKVYENLRHDIESSSEVNSSCDQPEACKSFVDETSDFSDISDSWHAIKRKLCEGCEEELANAVAQPCKHCYLCIECAFKIHRIYKKCKYCSANVSNYKVLTS